MKVYRVTFDFSDYIYESVRVYATNKRQVRSIMKRQYGNDVRIRTVEEE